MKRTFLTLLCIATLSMVGAVCFAQTDSASTGQPGVNEPAPAPAGTPVIQDSPSGTQQGSAPPPSNSDVTPPTGDEAAGKAAQSGTLPATASQNPLMAVIGALSLAAFTFLLVARRRGADNS
jgi:LPXTG-motif cell wall-anchored protein